MSKLFQVLAMTSIASVGSVTQADPVCPTGTLAYIEGEINNNAVAFVHLGTGEVLPITSGVAELKMLPAVKTLGKFTCALHGIPNDPTATGLDHEYDHRIVCSDHSEISYNTSFDEEQSPLDSKLARKLCQGDLVSFFQEATVLDTSEARKGAFSGVYKSEILVKGCVNVGDDNPPDIQINMVLEGYLCIED